MADSGRTMLVLALVLLLALVVILVLVSKLPG